MQKHNTIILYWIPHNEQQKRTCKYYIYGLGKRRAIGSVLIKKTRYKNKQKNLHTLYTNYKLSWHSRMKTI